MIAFNNCRKTHFNIHTLRTQVLKNLVDTIETCQLSPSAYNTYVRYIKENNNGGAPKTKAG